MSRHDIIFYMPISYIYIIEMFKSKESQFGSIFVPGEKAIIFIGGVAVNGESLT